MPHAAATSSIDVWAKPVAAKARAAPRRMEARRSERGRSLLWTCIRESIHLDVDVVTGRGEVRL